MRQNHDAYRIPAPPGKPHYHEYAAGEIGDTRDLGIRLAEKIVEEDLPDLTRTAQDYVVAALARAFRAGRAYQSDNPEAAL